MTLLDRLPILEDAELTNLLNNARRLIESGPEKQRESAAELLPAIEEEIASRKARKREEIVRRAAEKRERALRLAERAAAMAEPSGAAV